MSTGSDKVESSDEPRLRPIERVIVRHVEQGSTIPEIARRVDKKPGTVRRILEMIEYRREIPAPASDRGDDEPLRPVERVVLRLRAEGENYGTIGNRLRRSGRWVKRIEEYARMKEG